MKTATARLSLFAFLLGAIVGAFAVVAISTGSIPGVSRSSDDDTAPITSRRAGAEPGPELELDKDRDDATLASDLEQARFERDWVRVRAVASVLESRKPKDPDLPPTVQPRSTPKSARSLLIMEYTLRERAFLADLANRDNPATRAARSGDLGEKEGRLVDLFQAPQVRREDTIVQQDAAYLLARLGTEGARDALLSALRGPDEQRARQAVAALGRAGDLLARKALVKTLREDPDPKLRLRALEALSLSRALVQGAPEVVEPLLVGAKEERDAEVRRRSIAALARTDLAASARARGVLELLAESDAEAADVREAAVRAMVEHHKLTRRLPNSLVAVLERLVTKTTGPLRVSVLHGLQVAGRKESITTLQALSLSAPDEVAALEAALQAIRLRSVESQ